MPPTSQAYTSSLAMAQEQKRQLHLLDNMADKVPTDDTVPYLLHKAFEHVETAMGQIDRQQFDQAQHQLQEAERRRDEIYLQFHQLPEGNGDRDNDEQLRQDLYLTGTPNSSCSEMKNFCQHISLGPLVQKSCPATCQRRPGDHRLAPPPPVPPPSAERQRFVRRQDDLSRKRNYASQQDRLSDMLHDIENEKADLKQHRRHAKHTVRQRQITSQTAGEPGRVSRQCQLHRRAHTFVCDGADPHCIDDSATLCSYSSITERLRQRQQHIQD